MKAIVKAYNRVSLILRIIIGLIIGAVLGFVLPQATPIAILGTLFVGALKAIAPVLVFFLIMSSISRASGGIGKRFRTVMVLYMVNTLLASILAVVMSFMFPIKMTLADTGVDQASPEGIGEVFMTLLNNCVTNPFYSIANANYLGILLWSVVLGLALKIGAGEGIKTGLQEFSNAITTAVRWIINLAPFGICGLVFSAVSENGMSIFVEYGKIIALLVGCMFVMVFAVLPLLVFVTIRQNPYPLVLRCVRDSGITAFFTRSSAANIPVNMNLCESLGLDKDFYSVSIPLGSTINMNGAAITITIMTLATASTLGIHVDIPTAIVLSLLAAVGACGASGVAGGSLLLIPMACSLFGISNDIAMQVVGVGFIIGVIQDSCETALNSSGDVVLCASAEFMHWKKDGKEVKVSMKSVGTTSDRARIGEAERRMADNDGNMNE
ncbi:MAG: serine/threonine transporter SstT [Clostridia bacterium]|nr:serine/threonine transporter SstT [Clostridia bacterium]